MKNEIYYRNNDMSEWNCSLSSYMEFKEITRHVYCFKGDPCLDYPLNMTLNSNRESINLLSMDREEFQYSKGHPQVQSDEVTLIPYEYQHLSYAEKPILSPERNKVHLL